MLARIIAGSLNWVTLQTDPSRLDLSVSLEEIYVMDNTAPPINLELYKEVAHAHKALDFCISALAQNREITPADYNELFYTADSLERIKAGIKLTETVSLKTVVDILRQAQDALYCMPSDLREDYMTKVCTSLDSIRDLLQKLDPEIIKPYDFWVIMEFIAIDRRSP